MSSKVPTCVVCGNIIPTYHYPTGPHGPYHDACSGREAPLPLREPEPEPEYRVVQRPEWIPTIQEPFTISVGDCGTITNATTATDDAVSTFTSIPLHISPHLEPGTMVCDNPNYWATISSTNGGESA